MKKFLSGRLKKLLALGYVLIMMFIGTAIPVDASEYMYVSGAETGAVYLRTAQASSSYIAILNNGTMVESIGWARGYDGQGYNQVRVNGMSGWITSRYLSYGYSAWGYTYSFVYGVQYSIYLWSDAYSGYYYGTIPVGSGLYVDYGSYTNGRYRAYYGGTYGWVTANYVWPY